MNEIITVSSIEDESFIAIDRIRNLGDNQNFLCHVNCKSKWLSFQRDLNFDRYHLMEIIDNIESMIGENIKELFLMQEYSEDYLKFENDRYGHIWISGKFSEDYCGNRVEFSIKTDQTVLKNIRIIFSSIIEGS